MLRVSSPGDPGLRSSKFFMSDSANQMQLSQESITIDFRARSILYGKS